MADKEGLDAGDELNSLQEEYTRVRDDSRTFWAVISALLSVAVLLVGGLVAIAVESCHGSVTSNCLAVSDWIWLGLPVGPITVVALVVQQTALSSTRSTYEKAIEERIRSLRPVVIEVPPDESSREPITLTIPAYSVIMNRFTDWRRVPSAFKTLNWLFNLFWPIIFLASVVVAISEMQSVAFQGVGGFIYFGIGLTLARARRASRDPRLARNLLSDSPLGHNNKMR